jgi:hypothetical protein
MVVRRQHQVVPLVGIEGLAEQPVARRADVDERELAGPIAQLRALGVVDRFGRHVLAVVVDRAAYADRVDVYSRAVPVLAQDQRRHRGAVRRLAAEVLEQGREPGTVAAGDDGLALAAAGHVNAHGRHAALPRRWLRRPPGVVLHAGAEITVEKLRA